MFDYVANPALAESAIIELSGVLNVSIPLKHHFLPAFLLSRWAIDGKVMQFRKFGGKIDHRARHPDATGFELKLYSIGYLEGASAQRVETEFFSPLDSKSADVLDSLSIGRSLIAADREVWSKFLVSLMTRMPSDIREYQSFVAELASMLLPKFEPIFQLLAPAEDQSGFTKMSEDVKMRRIESAVTGIQAFISKQRSIDEFSSFEWDVIDIGACETSLLISDRPVCHTSTFGDPRSHLVLPIGPRKIFVAAKQRSTIDEFERLDPLFLAERLNEFIVRNAEAYVFGEDVAHADFIQSNMGVEKAPTLFQLLRAKLATSAGDLDAFGSMVQLELVRELAEVGANKTM